MMIFLVHTEELLLFTSGDKNVYDGFCVFKMTIWNLNNNANNDGVHSSRKVENKKKQQQKWKAARGRCGEKHTKSWRC